MENYVAWMKTAYWISTTCCPAISVPAGFTDEGLPVGMQIVGRYRDDLNVLKMAHAFEQATDSASDAVRRRMYDAHAPTLDTEQLTRIDAQPPEMAKLTKAVLAKLRPRLPGAVEMVYDKRNALVIGFCPDERASNVINSIAVYSKWINLYFFEGDTLPDPEGLLQGTGTMVRSIRHDQRRRPRSAGREGVDGRGAEARRSAARSQARSAGW